MRESSHQSKERQFTDLLSYKNWKKGTTHHGQANSTNITHPYQIQRHTTFSECEIVNHHFLSPSTPFFYPLSSHACQPVLFPTTSVILFHSFTSTRYITYVWSYGSILIFFPCFISFLASKASHLPCFHHFNSRKIIGQIFKQ